MSTITPTTTANQDAGLGSPALRDAPPACRAGRPRPAPGEHVPRGFAPRAAEVRPAVSPVDRAAWVRYVERHEAATVFHHPDWCDTVEDVFHHRPLHLLATCDGEPVGVLPLMEVRSLLAGRLHVSVPYGTYGGLLADDPQVGAVLADAAAGIARQRGARVLELRSATADVPDFEPVEGYLGFWRDLPERVEDVAASLPKRARAAARHARDRSSVTVEHDPRLTPIVWELYCRSMHRIASLAYPRRFFDALARRLGPRAWASVAWCAGRPVAGTISLEFRDTLMPYVLGLDERIPCEGAANLLYWSVMERAVERGLRRFDYGRSRADNAGAVGFKKNQGFEPRPLGYQRYVPPGRRAPDLKPSNPRFAWARRAWRYLPLPVTRVLGAWLARSIPG